MEKEAKRASLYLVWLEWPEKCFRVDAEALRFLKTLVPAGSRIVRARTEAVFLRQLPQATHVLTWHFKKEWFARASKLKMLATPGAGRELVSLEAPKGVTLHFGRFHGAIMSETVAAFVLAWARGFFAVRDFAGYGGSQKPAVPNWPRAELSDRCFTVSGTQAVVVGYGRVGGAIGAKLEALGVAVKGFSRHNMRDLDAALKTADWLVLALPSDTGTDDFLSRVRLRKLPRRAVVINVGRGNAIDEPALVEALRTGRLAGAYLDVFLSEPGPLQKIVGTDPGKRGDRPRQNVGTDPTILGTDPALLPPNLIRTPHSSAFSRDYMKRCFTELNDDGCL